jgi:tetratricopeptide (TPR) repeat protein
MHYKIFLVLMFLFVTGATRAQQFENYRPLLDTTLFSKSLGFEKGIAITVPIDWQNDLDKRFPLIVIFDKQNQRSHNYILQTIDYLTSTDQMPSCVVVSVNSEGAHRYNETQYVIADKDGKAKENEVFIFDELIPLCERMYHASNFHMLIGHSRYGYFTTAMLTTRMDQIHSVISLSPFFHQDNVSLTDSINNLKLDGLSYTRYYRFGIGNDYPDDFFEMDSIVRQIQNPLFNAKGYHFKEADHYATPGLTIATAIYEIFEKWSVLQLAYFSDDMSNSQSHKSLEKKVETEYGAPLCFSLGILNGKGWNYFGLERYEKAIEAWEIMMEKYPNFSEGYLYIMEARKFLKSDSKRERNLFLASLERSSFYSPSEKADLLKELERIE